VEQPVDGGTIVGTCEMESELKNGTVVALVKKMVSNDIIIRKFVTLDYLLFVC
jgi:hypothetical protein